MKHTKKTASFLSGMLTALLLVGMVTPALASGLSKRIEVSSGVSIYVDDVKLNPRDANGNPVEVFIYNGTTYLPVRAVSEALEMPVQWDGSTRSVYVGKHTGDKPAVWLADMDYFDKAQYWSGGTTKDNLGNEHNHSLYVSGYAATLSNEGAPFRTYKLNGKYSRLTGTYFQQYEARTARASMQFEIYADGEKFWSATMKSGVDPVNFDIDISGVLELELRFEYSRYSYENVALGDIGLWT